MCPILQTLQCRARRSDPHAQRWRQNEESCLAICTPPCSSNLRALYVTHAILFANKVIGIDWIEDIQNIIFFHSSRHTELNSFCNCDYIFHWLWYPSGKGGNKERKALVVIYNMSAGISLLRENCWAWHMVFRWHAHNTHPQSTVDQNGTKPDPKCEV